MEDTSDDYELVLNLNIDDIEQYIKRNYLGYKIRTSKQLACQFKTDMNSSSNNNGHFMRARYLSNKNNELLPKLKVLHCQTCKKASLSKKESIGNVQLIEISDKSSIILSAVIIKIIFFAIFISLITVYFIKTNSNK